MRKITLLITLWGMFLVILSGCQPSKPASTQEQPPVPVMSALPSVRDVQTYIEAIGVTRPSVEIELRSQIGGEIREIFVKEGDWVVESQPLFQIDPRLYAIKVEEAKAQLNRDQIQYAAAIKKLDRYRQLARKDLVAQVEWDTLETASEEARLTVELNLIRLKAAQLDLDRSLLLSPLDGKVGEINIYPGNTISPSEIALKIANIKELLIEFYVTELELSKLKDNVQSLQIDSLSQTKSNVASKLGKITFFDYAFDAKSGQIKVKAVIENTHLDFYGGQVVRVKIPSDKILQAFLIPHKAVRYNEQGPYVYLLQDDQTVAVRQLLLGDIHGNEVVVLQGLDPQDQIITDGHLRISPGAKVEVIKS